jgi:hypothetical protein
MLRFLYRFLYIPESKRMGRMGVRGWSTTLHEAPSNTGVELRDLLQTDFVADVLG